MRVHSCLGQLIVMAVLLAWHSAASAQKHALMQEDVSYVNPLQYGSALNATTLNAAITGIGSNKRALFLSTGAWKLAANVTVPSNVTLIIPAGSTVTVNAGVTLTINGLYHADLADWYSGPGMLIRNAPSVVARTMGMTIASENATTGTGTSRDPWSGWDAQINWDQADQLVYFPSGFYTYNSPIVVSGHRIEVRGAGKHRTRITFTGTGTAWKFQAATAVPIAQNVWGHLGLLASDTSTTKIGLDLVDVSEFHAEEFCIGCNTPWTGGTSIGLRVQGREVSSIRRGEIKGDTTIQISPNPNNSISIDHFHFEDLYLLCTSTSAGSAVLIDSNVNLANVTFDGSQAWVRCGTGLKWIDTATRSISLNLSLNNIRWEQSMAADWFINIQHNHALLNATFTNIFSGTSTAKGIRLRNVRNVTMTGVQHAGINGLDIDDTDYPVVLNNSDLGTGIAIQNNQVTVASTKSISNTYGLRVYDVITAGAMPISGSWTPLLEGGTVAGVQTYSTQVGRYVISSNFFFFTGTVAVSAVDAARSGTLRIRGLPVPTSPVASLTCSVTLGSVHRLAHAAGYDQFVGSISAGAVEVEVVEIGNNKTVSGVPASAMIASTAIQVSGTCYTGS